MANGHGGARPNSGRKAGYVGALHSLPDATALIARGLTPIEIMIISMRRDWQRVIDKQVELDAKPLATKDEMNELYSLEATAFNSAERCAPYVHPKLSSSKIEGANEEIANGGVVLQLAPGDEAL